MPRHVGVTVCGLYFFVPLFWPITDLVVQYGSMYMVLNINKLKFDMGRAVRGAFGVGGVLTCWFHAKCKQVARTYTVKPVHTGMPWGQTFIPVRTGSGLERAFAFGEEQTTMTCTIDKRVIIQDVSSEGLQMIDGYMQIN